MTESLDAPPRSPADASPAPPRSLGPGPSPAGATVLAEAERFIAETALPMVEEHERLHPDNGFPLDADGVLSEPLAQLKKRMQQAAAEAGLYCPHLPEELGGRGLGLLDAFYVQEAVYREGLRGVQWMLAWTDGPHPAVRFWGAEARERLLGDFTAGRINIAFALTEPGAGSDFPALQTTARRDGDGWILNGRKHLITGIPLVEHAMVFAKVEGAARGELTCFLVPLDAPGVETSQQPTIMADGQTGRLRLTDVRVDDWAVVGQEGRGQEVAFCYVNWTRSRRGGQAAGLGRYCFERAWRYATQHRTFGKPLIELGPVEQMLSEMYLDLSALSALSRERLARLDEGEIFTGRVTAQDRRDISTVKAFNDDALYRIADRAIQVHGGLGVLCATGVERVFRLARNLRIPAGTAEIQRVMISRSLEDDGPVL